MQKRTRKKSLSLFSQKDLSPLQLGIYRFVRPFLFPFEPGTPRDIKWLSAEPIYMNAVTDRPYLVRQLFSPLPPPLELSVFMGSGADLGQSSRQALERATARGLPFDPLARLRYDTLSPSSTFTATEWTTSFVDKWIVMLVSIRSPDVEHSEGHLVAVLANAAQATIYVFDPNNEPLLEGSADPTTRLQCVLTQTTLHLVGDFFLGRIENLPPGFAWRRREVLPWRHPGPQAIQDSEDLHSTILNLAGPDTCSAWCILFVHLLLLTHRGPVAVANAMVAQPQWPHLRLVIARYGAFLSNLGLAPSISRQRSRARRRWLDLSPASRAHRFRQI